MTPRDFGPPTQAPRASSGPGAAAAGTRVAFVFGRERTGWPTTTSTAAMPA
jgi:tRNA C32,U32 (ribose-2'-O)-methylase TrmJ